MSLVRQVNPLKIRDVRHEQWKLTFREYLFRTVCRHRQGRRPNILLFCSRRGGSTWLLNTLASHPGMRYTGRPFMVSIFSRYRDRVPDLARAAGYEGDYRFEHVIHFEGDDLDRFERFARRLLHGQVEVYPTLHFGADYFHRKTDRIAFQITNATPMIEWFDDRLDIQPLLLFRHPIPTALSIMDKGWRQECYDFIYNRWFMDTRLNESQRALARAIVEGDSLLHKHVLDWTLKMLVPYRAMASGRHPDWPAVFYEQAVLRPEAVVEYLGGELDLPDTAAMLEQIRRPSKTVTASTADKVSDPGYLVGRWRETVDPETERDLMGILETFEIDLYRPGRLLPAERYLSDIPLEEPV